MGKFEFIVGWKLLLVGFLGGSVMKVDLAGVTKKTQVTSGFGLKVMLVRCLGVLGTCLLQLPCEILSNIS